MSEQVTAHPMDLIGKKIAMARTTVGMTQADLALRIGKSRIAISGMETGRIGLSVRTLLDIAATLQREPAALLPTLAELKGDPAVEPGELIRRYYKDRDDHAEERLQDEGSQGGQ